MKTEEAKLTSKGQITIPKNIRTALGLKTGGRVVLILEGREVVMIPKMKEPLRDLERIREELRKEGKLFTQKELQKMMKENTREWSKIE